MAFTSADVSCVSARMAFNGDLGEIDVEYCEMRLVMRHQDCYAGYSISGLEVEYILTLSVIVGAWIILVHMPP